MSYQPEIYNAGLDCYNWRLFTAEPEDDNPHIQRHLAEVLTAAQFSFWESGNIWRHHEEDCSCKIQTNADYMHFEFKGGGSRLGILIHEAMQTNRRILKTLITRVDGQITWDFGHTVDHIPHELRARLTGNRNQRISKRQIYGHVHIEDGNGPTPKGKGDSVYFGYYKGSNRIILWYDKSSQRPTQDYKGVLANGIIPSMTGGRLWRAEVRLKGKMCRQWIEEVGGLTMDTADDKALKMAVAEVIFQDLVPTGVDLAQVQATQNDRVTGAHRRALAKRAEWLLGPVSTSFEELAQLDQELAQVVITFYTQILEKHHHVKS